MSCGRGEGKTINCFAGYVCLKEEDVSALTDKQWCLFWRQLAERYEREMRIMTEARLFRNRVEHHTQMRGPELTADLLRLKKPILPHRWVDQLPGRMVQRGVGIHQRRTDTVCAGRSGGKAGGGDKRSEVQTGDGRSVDAGGIRTWKGM